MKTIYKILWSMFSAAICVLYKMDAFGGCSYIYLTDREETTFANCRTILAEQISRKYSTSVPTTLIWTGNAVWNTYGDNGYNGYLYVNTLNNTLMNKVLPIDKAAAKQTEICDSGYYVYQCSNGGTPYTHPSSAIFTSQCTWSHVTCSACPTHPKGADVTTGADFNKYTYTTGYSNEYIPVCALDAMLSTDGKTIIDDPDNATGQQFFAFWLQRECTASTEYANFHMISDCYAETTDAVTETAGTYNCTDATGTAEYPYYKL